MFILDCVGLGILRCVAIAEAESHVIITLSLTSVWCIQAGRTGAMVPGPCLDPELQSLGGSPHAKQECYFIARSVLHGGILVPQFTSPTASR